MNTLLATVKTGSTEGKRGKGGKGGRRQIMDPSTRPFESETLLIGSAPEVISYIFLDTMNTSDLTTKKREHHTIRPSPRHVQHIVN